MELDISTEFAEGTCVIGLDGEVDVYTAPRLKESLVEQIESGCVNVIVDLEGVGFIDSSGLGVLVGALRRAKEKGGAVRLVCTRDNILKIFRITGLEMKVNQYAKGERFIKTVEREAGWAAVNLAFRGAGSLPTLDEIENPKLWLSRVA